MSSLDWFIPGYFYEPKEGTQQLSVQAPVSFAVLGIVQSLGIGLLFLYFVWVFQNETIESVRISSEVLEYPFECKVLSPYSGQEIFDYTTSESSILSRSLVVYDECLAMLTEADVCHQNMTENNIMSVFGYELYDQSRGSQSCVDVPLNHIRFCKGSPSTGVVEENASLAFPSTTDYPSYSSTYFAVIDTDENTLLINESMPSSMHSKLLYFDALLDYELDEDTWTSNERNIIWVSADTVVPQGQPGVQSHQELLEINLLAGTVKTVLSTECCGTTIYVGFDVDTINDVGYVMFKQSGGVVDMRVIDNFSTVENYNVSSIPQFPAVTCPDMEPDAAPVRPITVSLSDTADASDNVFYTGCGTKTLIIESEQVEGEPPGPPEEYTYFYVRGYHVGSNVQTDYELELSNITDTTGNGGGDRVTYIDIAYIYQIFTVSRSSAPAVLYMTGTADASGPQQDYYLLQVDLNSADKKVITLELVETNYLHRIFTSFSGDVGPPTPNPSNAPSGAPTSVPSPAPTVSPSPVPTASPTASPTPQPSPTPGSPTEHPSHPPTHAPTALPTTEPTVAPTVAPTAAPSEAPTPQPSPTPGTPTAPPSHAPTKVPTAVPTAPTSVPTTALQTKVVVAVVTPLSGISATDFLADSTNTDAFKQTTADSIGNGVSSDDITVVSVTDSSGRRNRGLTSAAVDIDWSFVYVAEQVDNSGSATAESTASTLTDLVSSAISDGSFATNMGSLSSALSAVTVADSSYADPVATVIRTAQPSVLPTSSPPSCAPTQTPSTTAPTQQQGPGPAPGPAPAPATQAPTSGGGPAPATQAPTSGGGPAPATQAPTSGGGPGTVAPTVAATAAATQAPSDVSSRRLYKRGRRRLQPPPDPDGAPQEQSTAAPSTHMPSADPTLAPSRYPTAVPSSSYFYYIGSEGFYYSTLTQQRFRNEGLLTPATMTHALKAQIIMQYSMCNGNVTTDNVGYIGYDTPGTFKNLHCNQVNAMYFQLSKQINVPTFCQDLQLTPSEFFDRCFDNHEDGVDDLLSQWNALQEQCTDSYHKICTAVFTDNPPFACTYEAQPSFLSVFSNAFAGTEFMYVLFSTSIMMIITFWPMIKEWFGEKYDEAGEQMQILRAGSFRGENDVLDVESTAKPPPASGSSSSSSATVVPVDGSGYVSLPLNSPTSTSYAATPTPAPAAASKYQTNDLEVVEDF